MLRLLRNGLIPCIAASLALAGCASDEPAPEKNSERSSAPETPTPVRQVAPAGGFFEAPLTQAPEAITSFGAAELDGRWYVIGGHIGETHAHSTANHAKAFRCLDEKGTWSELPGGVSLQSVSLVAHDGHLIRVGGVAAKNKAGEKDDMHSTDEVSSYDPSTKSWTALAPLPTKRSSHDACVLDNKVYVFGGWKLASPANGEWPGNGFVLDLTKKGAAWQVLPQPFKRRAVAVTAARGKVYVMGGLTDKHEISQAVSVFDVASGKWSDGPELPGPGFGASACTLEGRVYATDFDGNVSRLSDDGSKWEVVYRLAFARFFHRLIPAGKDRLVAICGSSKEAHTRSIEWINLTEAGPRVTTMRFAYKGNAKQRQGVFATGSVLVAFGGNTEMDQHMFEPENFSKQVWRFDIANGEVTALKDLPVQRQSISPLVFEAPEEDRTWLLGYGGFGFENTETVSHAANFVYDAETDTWKDLGVRLPLPLTQIGLALQGGKVWVFGGMDFDPRRGEEKRFALSDAVYAWDPHADKEFIEQARLPRSRRAFGCAVIDGKAYLVGGLKQGFAGVPECDVFDFKTKTWSTIPAPARPRVSPNLVAFEGKLWMAGGSSPKLEGKGIEANQSLECFDPATQTWSIAIEKMPIDMKESQCFASGTRLVVYTAARKEEVVEVVLVDPRR